MARKKDPKQEKYEGELIQCMNELDRAMGRVIRWSNKLATLRQKRSRLQRELVKLQTPLQRELVKLQTP